MIDEKLDFIVICATEYERDEVVRALTVVTEWTRNKRLGGRMYNIMRIAGQKPESGITIGLSSPNEIGRLPSAILARDIIFTFLELPSCVILSGIAAAAPNSEYQLGDLIIPETIYDYAEQKHSEGGFKVRARTFNLRTSIRSQAIEFARTEWFKQVPEDTVRYAKQTNQQIRVPAQCHDKLGLACGDYVLDNESLVKEILHRLSANQTYAVKAVDMESSSDSTRPRN